jgi:hypothetical protein
MFVSVCVCVCVCVCAQVKLRGSIVQRDTINTYRLSLSLSLSLSLCIYIYTDDTQTPTHPPTHPHPHTHSHLCRVNFEKIHVVERDDRECLCSQTRVSKETYYRGKSDLLLLAYR